MLYTLTHHTVFLNNVPVDLLYNTFFKFASQIRTGTIPLRYDAITFITVIAGYNTQISVPCTRVTILWAFYNVNKLVK